jgi:superfamily II DNA or RNA helicase
MGTTRVKKNTMNEFLDGLKEASLPGVWSKGVQASRSLKSIEKTSPDSDSKELRFKIITPERMLAFQVTLWPDDQDTHCNCGSKVEPCHHIVAVALAYHAGLVPKSENAQPDSAPRLKYEWNFSLSESGELPRISLKRTLWSDGTESPLPSSLITWVGGVQSGRIKGSIPSLTSSDLKIDELYQRPDPSWSEVLRILSELPPIPVTGHPTLQTLRAASKPEVPVLKLRALERGRWILEPLETHPKERLQGGLFIRNDTLGWSGQDRAFTPRVITTAEIAHFLTQEIHRLRERFVVEVEATNLPTLLDRDPELKLKIHALEDGRFSVTATLDYGPIGPSEIVNRNPAKERDLSKLSRDRLQLAIDQPKIMQPSELLALRSETGFFRSTELDSALSSFLSHETELSLESALAEKDTLLKLLRNREKKSTHATQTRFLLSQLGKPRSTRPLEPLAEAELTPEIRSCLRDYQRAGIAWLNESWHNLGGAILADDMGLGKTLQTLAILKKPSIVIVPTSLLQNWKTEAARFRPDLNVSVYHGADRHWNDSADLILTTYSILRAESARISSHPWKVAALDEAHMIRNPETQAAIATSALQAEFKLVLTGTPIQNRNRDLFSLFQFVAPALFEHESEMDPKLTQPFFLRRLKTEVLGELPPKTKLEHRVELNPQDRQLYEAMFLAAKAEILSRLEEDPSLSPLTLFEVLLRSRQACNHPGLIDQGRIGESSSKMEAILELVATLIESGQSVLLYSQWTRFLDLLESRLNGSVPLFRLDGQTRNRGQVVDEFQNSKAASVFLLSLHAGGVGLNLIKATHVVFCDPWWNPYVELQAEDRAYRMGQEKPVTIHRFLADQTIEMQIQELQNHKFSLGEGFSAPKP